MENSRKIFKGAFTILYSMVAKKFKAVTLPRTLVEKVEQELVVLDYGSVSSYVSEAVRDKLAADSKIKPRGSQK